MTKNRRYVQNRQVHGSLFCIWPLPFSSILTHLSKQMPTRKHIVENGRDQLQNQIISSCTLLLSPVSYPHEDRQRLIETKRVEWWWHGKEHVRAILSEDHRVKRGNHRLTCRDSHVMRKTMHKHSTRGPWAWLAPRVNPWLPRRRDETWSQIRRTKEKLHFG